MAQKELITKAFEMGRNWGETYSGWFIASPENHEQKLQECIEQLASDVDLVSVSKSTIKHKIIQGIADCGWSVLRSFQENESWETAISHLVKYLEKKGIDVGK